MNGGLVKTYRWSVLAAAFVLCAGFSADSAGKACVKEKGVRGTGYDVNKTKLKEAYSPNGRRMIEDGHRVYEVEVPPLIKRDKPIMCTLALNNGNWRAPGPDPFRRNPFALGNSPFTAHEKPLQEIR
jgi:hypothetical protein